MSLSGWRDAAIVLLIVETFVGVLIVCAVFYFCIRGVLWLKKSIPTVTRPAQEWLGQAERVTRRAGDAAIAPFVRTGASAARLKAVWRQIGRSNERSTHV